MLKESPFREALLHGAEVCCSAMAAQDKLRKITRKARTVVSPRGVGGSILPFLQEKGKNFVKLWTLLCLPFTVIYVEKKVLHALPFSPHIK